MVLIIVSELYRFNLLLLLINAMHAMFFFFFLWKDQNELLSAKTFLEQAAATNIAEFLKALSEVLANVSCSPVARTAAGLQLKNHLSSKDISVTEQYHKRWLSFQDIIREYIKNNVSIYWKSS